MTGFEIYLAHQPEGNTGNLRMSIFDDSGKKLDDIFVDLSKVPEASWYKVYTSADLKEDREYILRFKAEDCATIPYLQCVDSSYLPDETITGDVLLVYAYAESTFTFQNKVIFALFIVAAWGLGCAEFLNKGKKAIRIVSAGIFMTAVLTWNYMYNSMDTQNSSFSNFQSDSETLVTSVIRAEENGVYFRYENEAGYGLGRYHELKGTWLGYGLDYITDDNWLSGYSRTQGAILVNYANIYNREVAVEGNYLVFENGEKFQITNVEDNGNTIVLYLNTDKILTPEKYGSLDDVIFYNQSGQPLAKGILTAYTSQYGLQGKVFRHLARYMEKDQILANLNLLCSMAAAGIFVVIVLLIAAKYNKIMAAVFLVVFWLSPWIVNFAKNLYWVEFTWFIPMAIGLFCAWKVENRKCRLFSYIVAFVAIAGKCLCGYEYISVIMMGLIAFMLVDFGTALINKNKTKASLLFRTILIMGIVALAGFIAAICVHASLRGQGNILEGIKYILEQDVLRRTVGGDMNNFDESLWMSFNASIWETFSRYFHFNTEIITGVTGTLFPLLCLIPVCILGYEYKMKKLNVELMIMYIVFFITSISWFCLAKGHSYIHTHINYVLWYFGFIQICIYIIVNKIVEAYKSIGVRTKGEI